MKLKYQHILKAENIIQYSAVLDNKLIGMAAVSFESGEASIFGFGISPQYQGKGFGKELISLILEDLDKRGINDITIEVIVPIRMHSICIQKSVLK